jgi:dipeptidyl aminopeptidase/acylaminoacyl peptidase
MASLPTFEALLDCKKPSMVELSADGERLAFLVTPGAPSKDDTGRRQLWVGAPGGEVAAVPGQDHAFLPCFSPDGRRLAFTADPDGRGIPRLHLREPSGEVRALGGPEGMIEEIRWSEDGSRLLVLAPDLGSHGAMASNWKRIDAPGEDADPEVTRPDVLYRRLFFVDAGSGETTEVGPEGWTVWEVDWAGAGAAVAIVSRGTSETASYQASLALLDLDTRECRILYEPEWQLQSPTISAPGEVAFVEGWNSDRGIGGGSPRLLDRDTGEARVISAELHDRYTVQRIRWLDDGSLFYVGQAGLETMCGRLRTDGTLEPIWQGPATLGETHVHLAAISDDGRLVAAVKEGPGQPPEVMTLDTTAGGADWKAITSLNDDLRGFSSPDARRVAWQSDGVEIEGILVTPEDCGAGRLPLVVIAHGGPVNAWTFNYSFGYDHLGLSLVQLGYAVLLPNPRGGTGRGQDFAQAHLGAYGPMDLADIEARVESLDEAGIIDRERVGITGDSGGGYLSAYAATRSKLFKAAVPKACVTNWLSFHFTSNVGHFDELVLESDPFDPKGNHILLSPVMYAREAVTPTLIIQGALDLICPVGQAQELYQALVEVGVEAELVVHRQAGHEVVEREYLLDQWDRIRAWFDRHLAPRNREAHPN